MEKAKMKIVSFVLVSSIMTSVMASVGKYDPMLCNDFGGVEVAIARGDPFNGLPRTEQNNLTINQFVQDPFANLASQSLMDYALAYIREFHYLTVLMEANAKAGSPKKFKEYADVLSERLTQYDQHISVFGDGVLRKNRLRFEYAISRIINNRAKSCVVISADIVRQMLPKVSGEIAIHAPTWLRKQETFRNMLVIGAQIECYRRERNRLPDAIEELDGINMDEKVDAWGEKILYTTNGKEWRLFSAGGDACSEIPVGSAVLPEIDMIKGGEYHEVWFSSDYSEMRRSLFEGNTLNAGCPRYECVLDGNCVRRR